MEKKLLMAVKSIARIEVERSSNKWPPTCMGILHQPRRPKKDRLI